MELTTEDAIRILDASPSSRIKQCIVKLIPRSSMRSVIINNLPEIISEKDLFLVLNKVIPNLKRVIIADDSEVCLAFSIPEGEKDQVGGSYLRYLSPNAAI